MKGVWLLVELCGCAGGTQGLGWADSIGISLAQVPPCPHQCHVAAPLSAGTMCCLCLLAARWLLSRPLQQISSMKRSSLLHCRDLRERAQMLGSGCLLALCASCRVRVKPQPSSNPSELPEQLFWHLVLVWIRFFFVRCLLS